MQDETSMDTAACVFLPAAATVMESESIMKDSVFIKRSIIQAPVEDVFEWHERPGALERLTPHWDRMKVVERSGGILPGGRTVLKMQAGPVPFIWVAEHTDYEKPRMFRDMQVKGPFAGWVHTHSFEPAGSDSCVLEDRIDYRLMFNPFGRFFMGKIIRDQLEAIFAFRHRTFAEDMALHYPDRDKPRMTFLISGAGGVIGSVLIPFLTTGGHRVIRLVRDKSLLGSDTAYWNPKSGVMELNGLPPVDAVIHLAGENIGKGAWTDEKKKEIIESRTRGTALIADAVSKLDPPPKTMLTASAIGYYGNRDECILTEDDECGCDFISDVCDRWEQAADSAADKGIRVVHMRIGVALTPRGGALEKLILPFQLGLGGKIGTGGQYMSWVGVDDVAGAVYHILMRDDIHGPVNIVSPNPVTNEEFTRTLSRVLKRPAPFTVPESAINALYGEMGKEVPLSSTRVSPVKLTDTGYRFRHPDLEDALRHLLGKLRFKNHDYHLKEIS